jgi:hypothetical protein
MSSMMWDSGVMGKDHGIMKVADMHGMESGIMLVMR